MKRVINLRYFVLFILVFACKSVDNRNSQQFSTDCYVSFPKSNSIVEYLKSQDYLIKKNNLLIQEFLESNSKLNLLIINTHSGYDVYQDVEWIYSDSEGINLRDDKMTKELKNINLNLALTYLSNIEVENILSYCPTKNSSKQSITFFVKKEGEYFYITIDNGNLSQINNDNLKNQYNFLNLFEKELKKIKID